MSAPNPRRRFIEKLIAAIGLGIVGTALAPTMAAAQTASYFGKYRGVVTNALDPIGLGRIKANVPDVLGSLDTGWALPCAPYAGAGVGFFTVPPVGAGVWIEFEGGNPNYPIWSGGWWKSYETPSLGSPSQKIFKTSAGHTVLLDDTVGNEHIQIKAAGGAEIALDKGAITLSMSSTQLKISATGVYVNGKRVMASSSSSAISELLL